MDSQTEETITYYLNKLISFTNSFKNVKDIGKAFQNMNIMNTIKSVSSNYLPSVNSVNSNTTQQRNISGGYNYSSLKSSLLNTTNNLKKTINDASKQVTSNILNNPFSTTVKEESQGQPHKYGDIHFISFLSSVLARLAYCNDNTFLNSYKKIMGPIISTEILKNINDAKTTDLLNDEQIFKLRDPDNKLTTYEYNDKLYIDFIGENMPQKINENTNVYINNDTNTDSLNTIKYISIGWSTYGEVYVVADKRIPNTIFLLFRGTYNKTTSEIWLKPTSVVPLVTCMGSDGTIQETFLSGIFRESVKMIHTIVEAVSYLTDNWLVPGQTNTHSVRIFTTGHSLGGAMCTIFAYLYMGITKTEWFSTIGNNLMDSIVCVSLGAPRCMGIKVAEKFCSLVKEGKIMYLRITTNGDPAPSVPPVIPNKKYLFQHPCSGDESMRKQVSEACSATLIDPAIGKPLNIDYNANLNCLNYKPKGYNPKVSVDFHLVYLDINYKYSGNTIKFDVNSNNGNDVCRLIVGCDESYSVIFFNATNARVNIINNVNISNSTNNSNDNSNTIDNNKQSSFLNNLKNKLQNKLENIKNIAERNKNNIMYFLNTWNVDFEISEDIKITKSVFENLMKNMKEIKILPDETKINLCPLKPYNDVIHDYTEQNSQDFFFSCPMKYLNNNQITNPVVGGLYNKKTQYRNKKQKTKYRNKKQKKQKTKYRKKKQKTAKKN